MSQQYTPFHPNVRLTFRTEFSICESSFKESSDMFVTIIVKDSNKYLTRSNLPENSEVLYDAEEMKRLDTFVFILLLFRLNQSLNYIICIFKYTFYHLATFSYLLIYLFIYIFIDILEESYEDDFSHIIP